jgi:pimeloyl-ACP methyl ester carboxylesterase
MPKVKVGDINIYYEIHGKGEPLVLIPGSASSGDIYFMHVPVFSREYRVVTYDPRGAGRSDAPDNPYSMEMMADDLAGLLDVIGIDSAHILGLSMGGSIAQHFALRYPKKVISLILGCANCGGPHFTISNDPEVIDFFQNPKELSPEEGAMRMFRLTMSQEFIDKNPGLMKRNIEELLKHPAPPQGQIGQWQANMGHDTYAKLPEIKVPTLVIHGDADRIVPVENGRVLASRIPGAELAILSKMGHLFSCEAFDESNRIMLDFLRRHRTKA